MIGIYKLYWPTTEYYYIGQSIHIANRFKNHIHLLKKNRHPSRKLQDVYAQLGEPKMMVLEVCKQSELGIKEQYYLAHHIP